MKFKSELTSPVQLRVESCDAKLNDPERLAALAGTGLMDTPNEVAFDRLARLAAQILKVPLTIISLVGDKKQFFKAGYGLPSPYDRIREVPIDSSICRYTLAGHEIIAADTSNDALLMHHPTTESWGITAFMAIPMILPDGHVLGAFCAVDTVVHDWTSVDVDIMRELTNSVMTEIQLRMRLDELGAEREMRENFVATLSHDLRNPIGLAMMSADILRNDEVDETERTKLLTMISGNMERADLMIRDLLTVSSLKSGEPMHLELKACDLAEMVKSLPESFSRWNENHINLQKCDAAFALWDAMAIRRIIENLIGNAIKYGSSGTPVTISLENMGKNILIIVHNEGNPIPAETIPQLFEPYRRSESAHRGKHKGWGIGLTLVKGLVDAHEGKISVESSLGQGTAFKITLPIRQPRSHLSY